MCYKGVCKRNPAFQAKEIVNQRISKQNARKDPFILECERIKKLQNRQRKRKLEEMSGLDVQAPNKNVKSIKDDNLHDQSYKIFNRKGFKSIKECIKQFHSDIAVGPLFVCTCCHQTWFRKRVSMLKKTHIPAQSKRIYCTKFASVHNEEWVLLWFSYYVIDIF